MNDCMPWPVLDFYALALLDTCVLCITLPAVKKGLAFCCIDWTRYTPALTSSTGAAKRANLASKNQHITLSSNWALTLIISQLKYSVLRFWTLTRVISLPK